MSETERAERTRNDKAAADALANVPIPTPPARPKARGKGPAATALTDVPAGAPKETAHVAPGHPQGGESASPAVDTPTPSPGTPAELHPITAQANAHAGTLPGASDGHLPVPVTTPPPAEEATQMDLTGVGDPWKETDPLYHATDMPVGAGGGSRRPHAGWSKEGDLGASS